MAYLENAVEIPPPMREEVVSPSQSAFGLRAYEDEGEDGEGEAPSEEEEDFEEADIGEDDWDTVSAAPSRGFDLSPFTIAVMFFLGQLNRNSCCRFPPTR